MESWYNERMSKFDEDAAFREVQEGKYGDRDGYSRSVLGVAEGKISGARSKAVLAAEKAAAERLAAEEAEAERLAAEEAESVRLAAEEAEAVRLAAEEAEAARLAAEEAAAERLAAEEAEAARPAVEVAEADRKQAIEAAAQLWAGMHSSACEGLNEAASAKMRAFT